MELASRLCQIIERAQAQHVYRNIGVGVPFGDKFFEEALKPLAKQLLASGAHLLPGFPAACEYSVRKPASRQVLAAME